MAKEIFPIYFTPTFVCAHKANWAIVKIFQAQMSFKMSSESGRINGIKGK